MKVQGNETTPVDIEINVFGKKTVWSLIFSAKEGTDFVSGRSRQNEEALYEKMVKNVSEKLKEHGATLKDILVNTGTENRRLDMNSAKELMSKIIILDLPLIFRVQIENKNYDYQVK